MAFAALGSFGGGAAGGATAFALKDGSCSLSTSRNKDSLPMI